MAEIEKIALSQLNVNEHNPRYITDKKMDLLVQRLLAFPKMIDLRPIVVDDMNVALGGNMRLRAFGIIAEKNITEIESILAQTKNFQKLTETERINLCNKWAKWLHNPFVPVVKASTLTEEEKKEFIIADNASFGSWDYDALANEWDAEELINWGVDLPITESNINMDEFFDSLDNEDEKSKGEKLTIIIPDEYADQKDEMRSLIETALSDYSGIKVK